VGVTATGGGLDEVRTTLGAALADPAVDRQVRAGRVDRPLSYGGFGEVDMAVAGPARSESGGPKDSPEQAAAGALVQLAAARRELAAAERERAAVESHSLQAGAGLRAARKRVETLETELDRARDALAKAEDEATQLKAQAAVLTATIEKARSALAG
jgi:chromosome segregation ATPase